MGERGRSHRALTPEEHAVVLGVLHQPRFVDLVSTAVCGTLLDEESAADTPWRAYGLAEYKWAKRAVVPAGAHAAHPERLPNGIPKPPAIPSEVWINKLEERITEERQ